MGMGTGRWCSYGFAHHFDMCRQQVSQRRADHRARQYEPKGKSRPVKRDMASEEAALARELDLRTVHSRSTNSRFMRLRSHRGSQLGLFIARVLRLLFCILSTDEPYNTLRFRRILRL